MTKNVDYVEGTIYNLKGMRTLKFMNSLEKGDIKYIKAKFTTVGLEIDPNSVKQIVSKRDKIANTQRSKKLPLTILTYDDKEEIADYGEILAVTLSLGKFLCDKENLLKDFCVNYFQNKLAIQASNYRAYRNTKDVPKEIFNLDDSLLPPFFKPIWKNSINFEAAKRGIIVHILQDSERLKNLLLKWVYVCGIQKIMLDYDNIIDMISMEEIFSIFNFCIEGYNDYINKQRGELTTKRIRMDLIVTICEDETFKLEKEYCSLEDAFNFELCSYTNHDGNVINLCKCCKEFYYGNPRQRACSTRCRDILSGKYEKKGQKKNDKTNRKR